VIPREIEAEILRLHHAEKWPIGTIAAQLKVHHEVVERVLAQDGAPQAPAVRLRLIDPYLGFVNETWTRYPKLPASRLWAMCRERGYPGAKDHFRTLVSSLRPRPREAFLRLTVLPGEQGQFDWAHFGYLEIGRAKRPLLAFVGVLSWSRALYVRYFLGQQLENLLRGHEGAFATWKGVVRVALYDNPKTIVIERVGQAIRFNEQLLGFAAHYRYEPRPVAVARGNEKARVERAIRYVRTSFFVARRWRDLDDLNRQAEEWCQSEAMERPWPQDPRRTVRQAFEEEQTKLLPLPAVPYPTDERREVSVGKTPYVRFDQNDYSVPPELVHRSLVVSASLEWVRVLKDNVEVARHSRSYDKGALVEDPAHIQALVDAKAQAREQRGTTRLVHAAPSTQALLQRLAERGQNLGNATVRLLVLLDMHGAEALEAAVREVLARDVPHVHAVRQVLERERAVRGLPPALPIALPEDPRLGDIRVRPHSLESYGALQGNDAREEESDGEGCPALAGV
jgi:transposase